jgi:ATP adenylyltransferase
VPHRTEKRDHLFVPSKQNYARGERPKVDCILCEIVAERDTVDRLEITRTDHFLVSLNLHPYNPGHVMVFPRRHILHPAEFTGEEVADRHRLELRCIAVLDQLYRASGYNVGYNLGRASGASIEHWHLHIVPRYERELGFMDIIGGAKIMVEDPIRTRDRLREAFAREG